VDLDRSVVSEFNNFGIKRRMIRTYARKLVWQERADRREFMATVGNPALLPSVNFTTDEFLFYDLLNDPFEQKPLSVNSPLTLDSFNKLRAAITREGSTTLSKTIRTSVKPLDGETIRDLEAMGYIH
jgi:hypothetical protein